MLFLKVLHSMASEDKTPAISFRVSREQYERLRELAEARARGRRNYSVNLYAKDLVLDTLESVSSGASNTPELTALREEVHELESLLLQIGRNLNRATEGVLASVAGIPKRIDSETDPEVTTRLKREYVELAREWVARNMPIT
ncbi:MULTISPECIES: hypothetical protein [Cyanophyceae]|uniref:hypothetical protein n=1 Tax=Cyanophyceae TaxID=3028117 RepID=UPI001688B3C2|nr:MULTISPECIES: hypothetical protein [Cyanophyceae]MBD1877140.1 hypothetical protein [Nodosilinea sp. FACHB-131]MBD1919444.1 hypothetical protein [Phormidium sp. FACHB-77]MBD2054296.1 hypothetical protein [Leptolyngbya sp. FACHB-60]